MLDHIKGIAIHLISMVLFLSIGFYYLFNVYLPDTTNHGETLTVPNLIGLPINEVGDKLTKNALSYVIIDSTVYNSRFEPSAVMNQVPVANTKVKENRKIYLTVNAKKIPDVPLPDLSNKSLRNALITLERYGFKRDSVVYKPYSAPVVIGQTYNGRRVSAGDSLPRGSRVGLVIGLTEGNNEIMVPNLIGRPYLGLKEHIESYGLILSERWVKDDELPQNIVFKQSPMAADSTDTQVKMLKAGAIIDVWIAGEPLKDSIQ